MDRAEHKITLRFFNFTCSPAEITSILGIKPTLTGIQGESRDPPRARVARTWDSNYWAHQIDVDPTSPMDAHLAELMKILSAHDSKIRAIMQGANGELGIAMYYDIPNPGFHLDSDIVAKLGSLGIELDVDIYCFGKDD